MHHDTGHAAQAAWIADDATLAAFIDRLPASAPLGLDTEFMRRSTFYPQLALLQLAADGHAALVDPLAFAPGQALRARLADPATVCVMHSASEDLEALAAVLPAEPIHLFDTQIAAAMAGMGYGLSYQKLVAAVTGVELPKGETRSDWLQRPLTASQREYAAQDVHHLDALHATLRERLEARGRLAWHSEDCARLVERSRAREGDAQPQRAFRSAADWPRERQALLRRVLRWREAAARTLDTPRPWLLEDAQALSLSQQPPRTLTELHERTRGQRALRSAPRAELLDVLQRPLGAAEIEATAAVPGAPEGAAKRALAAMKQATDALAAELDLPGGLLCPRRALEEYVVTRAWPELLEGWRREVLEERLASLLPD
ncbi:MAG TPA: ribonuclease D [Mizugakiibacter sp.]